MICNRFAFPDYILSYAKNQKTVTGKWNKIEFRIWKNIKNQEIVRKQQKLRDKLIFLTTNMIYLTLTDFDFVWLYSIIESKVKDSQRQTEIDPGA